MPDADSVEVLPVELSLSYTYPEPDGLAEVTCIVPAGRIYELADGCLIPNDDLQPGMQVRLQEGQVGTLLAVKRICTPPEPPLQRANGQIFARVLGTIRHFGFSVLDVSWDNQKITGSPDHPYYSVTRGRYIQAKELEVGEFLRTETGGVTPVREVSPEQYGRFELYNFEVEHYHNFHVGEIDHSVLVHNGGGCVNQPKVIDLVDAIKNGKTLLVGEGNMSFALSLARKGRIDPKKLVVTTYESRGKWNASAKAAAEKLEAKGAKVIDGVDARNLAETLGKNAKFDHIVFQFPNMQSRRGVRGMTENHVLIRDFLKSAKSHLNDTGKVYISAVDTPYWRGQFGFEKAARKAGFTEPTPLKFDPKRFPGYEHTQTKVAKSAIESYEDFATWIFTPK